MALIEEFDHLMGVDNAGISQYTDEAALSERLREWLETPVGTVADMPGWGHPLSVLKFEPTGVNLNIMAEMLITEKLLRDIANLQLASVAVAFAEIDLLTVNIDFALGALQENVTL